MDDESMQTSALAPHSPRDFHPLQEYVHGWAHLVIFWAKSEAQEAPLSLAHPNSLEVTHL